MCQDCEEGQAIYIVFKLLIEIFFLLLPPIPHCYPLKSTAHQESIWSIEEKEKDTNMCKAGGNMA